MILYLDASALVKRYVTEEGSAEVGAAISQAVFTGTALVSRAEVAAALGNAVRDHVLTQEEAVAALQVFRSDWGDLVRIRVTEMVIGRADFLAWDHGLRGHDAVQLASALAWQDALGEVVTLTTFDKHLWAVAGSVGLATYPADLPAMLQSWKAIRESP
jgi:hypothetical protein